MDRLQVTGVRLYHNKGNSRIRASVQITFNKALVINDLKLIAGDDGMFWVGMPSRKLPDGKYRDIAYSLSAEVRDHIRQAVLQAYFNPMMPQVYPEGLPAAPKAAVGGGGDGATSTTPPTPNSETGSAPVTEGANPPTPGTETGSAPATEGQPEAEAQHEPTQAKTYDAAQGAQPEVDLDAELAGLFTDGPEAEVPFAPEREGVGFGGGAPSQEVLEEEAV